MAISITTLKGTNSLSADRITINDNFNVNTNAINELIGILNTTTGKFDNTGVGADSTITTEGITISTTKGVDVQLGNINVENGNITLKKDGSSIELGTSSSKIVDTVITVGSDTYHALLFENLVGIQAPNVTENTLNAIGVTGTSNLIVFDTTNSKFKGWNGTAWVELG